MTLIPSAPGITDAQKEQQSIIFPFFLNSEALRIKCANQINITHWIKFSRLTSQDIIFCHEHVHLLAWKTVQTLWDILVIIHHCKTTNKNCAMQEKSTWKNLNSTKNSNELRIQSLLQLSLSICLTWLKWINLTWHGLIGRCILIKSDLHRFFKTNASLCKKIKRNKKSISGEPTPIWEIFLVKLLRYVIEILSSWEGATASQASSPG